MSNGWDSTEAFLSGIEQEISRKNGGGLTGDSNGRPGRDSDRDRRERGGDSRRRPYDEDDRSRRRRGYGDDDDDRDEHGHGGRRSSRREYEHDHRRRDDYMRDRDYHRNGSGSARRDGYGYGYEYGRGAGHREDRYDDRHYGRDDRRGAGGGGRSWRDGPGGDAGQAIRRSPTPPGTIPISQHVRKNSKWNIPAPGYESMTPTQAKATGMFGVPGLSRTLGVSAATVGVSRDAHGNAIATPMGMSASGAASGALSAAAQQNSRQSRRLYVGNINVHTGDVQLCAFFNEQMRQMNFTVEDGDPVISAQVNGEKGYAFVEFRNAAEATNAMSFDGIVFQGQSMKIRRPKDYVGPDAQPPAALHVPGVISTNVPDGPNKIYIGGLPTYLEEDSVIDLLKSFGDLRSFNLVREAGVNGASKGFAFCEYVDPNLTDLAIQSLNDMELGDRRLLVQRASVGTSAQQRTATGMMGQAPATGANSTATRVNLAAPVAQGGEGGPSEPTKAMMLLNCVTPEELLDAEEYQEIVEDMRDECSKYGHVVDMRIPRPIAASKASAAQTWRQSTAQDAEQQESQKEREGVGRVYVLFDDESACKKALDAIAGRQFAGRTVIAAFIPEHAFPADEDGGRDAAETSMQAMSSHAS